MKIVHLDLPRRFTLSVRDYLPDVARLLQQSGHTYEQYDINPNFWKWLLGLSTPHSPRDLFEPVMAARADNDFWPMLAELKAHLNDIGRLYGMPIGLSGLELPPAVLNSSYAMCTLVADNFGVGLFSNFFQHLDARLHFRDADLIALGVENLEGVFWALQLAAWLRAADSTAHICIARHAWENFTLVHSIDALAKNSWFFGVIQSVILYEEDLPETLASLTQVLAGAPADNLHNIALKRGDTVQVLPPSPEQRTQLRTATPGYQIPPRYFAAMEVPPDQLVYCMAMARNKCFYRKCNFCVQVAKHVSDQAYAQPAEIARALDACEELQRHGITMVNFGDEAMRPAELREFCAGIMARHVRIHWIGRMIAAAHPNPDLLHTMKQAGCSEVLFGLETFDPALSADMGKISRLHQSAAETLAVLRSFLDAGLFLILSMIYEFPTERPDARQHTLAAVDRFLAATNRYSIIFNRFHLLAASKMYHHPEAFNIARIEPRLPENDLQYNFHYDCQTPHPPATAQELETMHRLSLNLPPDRYAALLARHGKDLLDLAYFLDYVSIGLHHRTRHNATLFAELFDHAET